MFKYQPLCTTTLPIPCIYNPSLSSSSSMCMCIFCQGRIENLFVNPAMQKKQVEQLYYSLFLCIDIFLHNVIKSNFIWSMHILLCRSKVYADITAKSQMKRVFIHIVTLFSLYPLYVVGACVIYRNSSAFIYNASFSMPQKQYLTKK